jgi:hypothetical protein
MPSSTRERGMCVGSVQRRDRVIQQDSAGPVVDYGTGTVACAAPFAPAPISREKKSATDE